MTSKYVFDEQSARRIVQSVLRSERSIPSTQRINGPPTRLPRGVGDLDIVDVTRESAGDLPWTKGQVLITRQPAAPPGLIEGDRKAYARRVKQIRDDVSTEGGDWLRVAVATQDSGDAGEFTKAAVGGAPWFADVFSPTDQARYWGVNVLDQTSNIDIWTDRQPFRVIGVGGSTVVAPSSGVILGSNIATLQPEPLATQDCYWTTTEHTPGANTSTTIPIITHPTLSSAHEYFWENSTTQPNGFKARRDMLVGIEYYMRIDYTASANNQDCQVYIGTTWNSSQWRVRPDFMPTSSRVGSWITEIYGATTRTFATGDEVHFTQDQSGDGTAAYFSDNIRGYNVIVTHCLET